MDFFSMLLERAINPSSGGGAEEGLFAYVMNANMLFHSAKSFQTKAVVNLPNTTTLYQAFAYWDKEPIPIVEELTVNAPNIADTSSNTGGYIGQMFVFNYGVKKVVLNLSDGILWMNSVFSQAKVVEEIVLNFPTKNIIWYRSPFSGCAALKRIVGVLDFSSATETTNMFSNCNSLEEVTFKPNTLSISISLLQSSKLTAESVQSIIDGLATVETTQNLTLHTNVVGKLTEEQFIQIADKNWNIQ